MQTIEEQIAAANVDKSRPDWRTKLANPKPATFDSARTYRARMRTSKAVLPFMDANLDRCKGASPAGD